MSKLDIYSDHQIPFMVGTWARAHKFNPTAVALTKTLNDIEAKKIGIRTAELELEMLESKLKQHISDAEEKMGALNGI